MALLRFFVIALVVVVISCAQFFVHKETSGQGIILLVISLTAFAAIPVLLKLWPIRGEKQTSTKRWLTVLVLITILLSARRLGLTHRLYDHFPALEESIRYLVSAEGGWLLPGIGACAVVAVIVYRHFRRERGPLRATKR